ncbi:hypothetical protein I4U23_010324 [Adineta vaga]|nr:hypothetical protein I4U23_010324 [Adineta vaga]
MDSSNDTGLPLKIFSIISLSLGFCCLLLCCAGYIVAKKKYKQQHQIHLSNHHHHHLSPAQVPIFSIDMANTPTSNTDHCFDTPPPPYELKEESLSIPQHESIVQLSPTEQIP